MERYDAHITEANGSASGRTRGPSSPSIPRPAPTARTRATCSRCGRTRPARCTWGHTLVYTIGDILARFRRRKGLNVLHVMGFDSFGLPAENAAIREGEHPRKIVERNIKEITKTMRQMGWGYDWSRLVSAHEPEYYRWTQWLFLRLFEAGLAYRKGAPVKWCPFDQVVLANEQVHDGKCEYCGNEVESKTLEQWFFKTDRLRRRAPG